MLIKKILFGIWLVTGTALALAVRLSLFPNLNMDVSIFFGRWYDHIHIHGFTAFRDSFYNYTPAYPYLLGMISTLSLPALMAVKSISVFFDLLAAVFSYKLVALRYPANKWIASFAYMACLFTPTVVLNGSFWGQGDMIPASLILASLYFLSFENKPIKDTLGIIFFAAAVSFKVLSACLLPFYVLVCLKKNIPLRKLLLIPIIYFLTLVPCWIAGRSLWDLLAIPVTQANTYKWLTINCPNIYTWFPRNAPLLEAGLFYSASIALILLVVAVRTIPERTFDAKTMVRWVFLFSLAMPFVLPRMHERYFFIANVLSVVYAFYFPRHFYISALLILVSLFSYMPFLFAIHAIPMSFLSLVVLFLLVVVVRSAVKRA